MKEICLSFQVRIRVERTDVNWLEATLLEERERCFQQGLLTVVRQVEGWAMETPGRPTFFTPSAPVWVLRWPPSISAKGPWRCSWCAAFSIPPLPG